MILGRGASCGKAGGVFSVSYVLARACLLQSLGEYSEGVSW